MHSSFINLKTVQLLIIITDEWYTLLLASAALISALTLSCFNSET